MFDLKDLYQEMIVDHNRKPRNFGKPSHTTQTLEGFNPLCGDRLTLYLDIDNDKIENIGFDGSGCAISVASASLMTDLLKGKSIDEAQGIFNAFHDMVTKDNGINMDSLGKLTALAGVRDYPARVKCATLCWHTLHAALKGGNASVSTE